MAQPFQSGSPYGAPYQPGPYYNTYQQFPSQQAPSISPFAPQNARNGGGYQPAPGINLARFETNSQAQAPNQNFAFAPPAPFPPDMFKQFANSSIPPPPPPNFPPVPIPSLAYPPFPQHDQSSQPLPSQHQMGGFGTSDVSDAYDPRYPQQLLYGSRMISAIPNQSSAVEDPPKNGGSTSSRTISQEEQTQERLGAAGPSMYPPALDGAAFSSQSYQHQQLLEDVSRSDAQHNIFATSNTPPSKSRHVQATAQQLSDPAEITSAASVPPVKQAGPPARPSSRGQETSSQQILISRDYSDKTSDELRQLAKGALLSLAPHSIHYPELLKEGIDARILRQLYDELGIQINIPETDMTVKLTSTPDSEVQGPPVSANDATQDGGQVLDAIAPSVSTSVAAIARPAPAPSPSMERKDRIAQLLAAKTGRPSPVRSFSESGASAGAIEQRSADDLPPPKDHEVPAEDSKSQAKPAGVVQAEALRLKMDKLHPERLITAPLERRNMDSLQSSGNSETAGGALQTSTQQLPLEASPLSSIPGLFMTSADPMRNNDGAATKIWDGLAATDSAMVSLKRPFEHDSQQPDLEPDAKRRNTEMTDATMDIDHSEEDDNASEGEILEVDNDDRNSTNDQVDSQAPRGTFLTLQNLTVTPSPLNITSSSQAGPMSSAPIPPSVNQTKMRLTSAQIAEKAEMLKARFLKQRAERQMALQEGLPDLDAEVQKTRSRLTGQQSQLAQIRSKIGRLDAELTEARAQEATLVDEIAHLEKQLKEGVSGQKQYADELKTLKSEHDTSETAPLTTPARQQVEVLPPTDGQDIRSPVGEDTRSITAAHPITQTLDQSVGKSDEEPSVTSESGQKLANVSVDINGGQTGFLEAEEAQASPLNDVVDSDQSPTGMIPEVSMADRDVESRSADVVDKEASSLVSEPNEFETEDRRDPDGLQENSEGSASMSDSGSDFGDDDEGEYEPEDGRPLQPIDDEGSEEGEYDPEDVQTENHDLELEEDVEMAEDDYEPQLEAGAKASTTPGSQMSEEMVDSPPIQSGNDMGPRGAQDEASVDQAAAIPPSRDDDLVVLEQKTATPGVVSHPDTENGTPAVASPATTQEPLTNSAATNGTSQAYAPYKSPLSSFQSFRYHEQFKETASSGGYRSLTYSNNIDPNVPLCHTELAGGVCEDATCEQQHFRHLGLSDDKILVSLSSANGIDKPQRDKYLIELKGVIAELRKNGVKDFEGVANALSEHRRKFFMEEKGEDVS